MIQPAFAQLFWYGEGPPPIPIPNPPAAQTPPTYCSSLKTISMGIMQQLLFNPAYNDNNPEKITGLTINKPAKSWDGYTLMSCVTGCYHQARPGKTFWALLIDNNGNFVNGWENIKAFPAKMLPGGYLMGTDREGTAVDSPVLVQQDWCGNEVWYWDSTTYAPGTLLHHDHNRHGSPVGYYAPGMDAKYDGKTLALAVHIPENEYYYPRSWVPEGHPARDTSNISTYKLQDDAIYIIDKDGRIKWQWFAADHFEQMGFSDAAKYGIMNSLVAGAFDPSKTDWTHFNNVNWLGENKWYSNGDKRFHPDNMIFDSRSSSLIAIIANDDYAGFKKGDIIWKVGPDYGPGTPWASLGQIIGPHHAHMIPRSLPGGGNILVFDNGGMSRYGSLRADCPGTFPSAVSDYSRIIEFNPTTYEIVWEYKNTSKFTDSDGNVNRKFFSTFISGVQRLANGNTLITEGNQARIFEVTPEKEIVWEYIAQVGDPLTIPGTPIVVGKALYRAYKVPKAWAPNVTCP